jgi:hypothetical protein
VVLPADGRSPHVARLHEYPADVARLLGDHPEVLWDRGRLPGAIWIGGDAARYYGRPQNPYAPETCGRVVVVRLTRRWRLRDLGDDDVAALLALPFAERGDPYGPGAVRRPPPSVESS